MTPSNLPPGVTENMIPGNRPEDIIFEAYFEEILDNLPEWVSEELDKHPETDLGKALHTRINDHVEKIWTVNDAIRELIMEVDHIKESPENMLKHYGKSPLEKAKRSFILGRKIQDSLSHRNVAEKYKRNICEMTQEEAVTAFCLLTQTTWDAEDLEVRILKRPGKGQVAVTFPIMVSINHLDGRKELVPSEETGLCAIQDNGNIQISMGSDKRQRMCLDVNLFMDYLKSINIKITTTS